MRFVVPPRRWRPAVPAAALLCLLAGDSRAIEMFTYFGDGSRIGLPSLEVPVEAYPGIPLRSDRLRARRRALRMGGGQAQPGPAGFARGLTIRTVPAEEPVPPRADGDDEPPVAPSPPEVDVAAPPAGPDDVTAASPRP